MPLYGDIRSVTVPGCVDGWVALHERHATMALDDRLAAQWAAALRDLGLDPRAGVPLAGGSTDMGNVSQVVPSIHPMIAAAPSGTSDSFREARDNRSYVRLRSAAGAHGTARAGPELSGRVRSARRRSPYGTSRRRVPGSRSAR